MTRYADPERCPDCGSAIRYGATGCASCGLSLEGQTANRLFATLQLADRLLEELRAATPPVTAPLTAPVAATSAATPGAPAPGALPPQRTRSRLTTASVPQILLGLGALCLLIAALVFLAVTWSVMGVGGRTATLLALTAVSAGLTSWVARRRLRAAAESLALVTLGLLAFDIAGARAADWFGDLPVSWFAVLLGVALAGAGTAAALAVRRTGLPTLVTAEVVAALGVLSVVAGTVAGEGLSDAAAFVTGTVLAGGTAFAAHRLRLLALATGAGVVAAGTWFVLTSTGAERAVEHPTARELWLQLHAWPLLSAALLVGALSVVPQLARPARVAALAVAEAILLGLLLTPFSVQPMPAPVIAVALVLLAAAAVAWFAPQPWATGLAASVLLAGLYQAAVAAQLLIVAADRVGDVAELAWEGTTALVLPPVSAPFPVADHGWLAPVVAAMLAVTLVTIGRSWRFVDATVAVVADLVVAAAAVWLGVAVALVLYPVPAWLPLSALLVGAVALAAWAVLRQDLTALVVAAPFLLMASALALADEWLTLVVLSLTLVGAVLVHLRWRHPYVAAVSGGLAVAVAGAWFWTVGALTRADETWTALVALLLIAGAVLAVPFAPRTIWATEQRGVARLGPELAAGLTGFALITAGVDEAPTLTAASWLAVYLTVAGAAASALALLQPDRRPVGWLGGFLLASATWVRLADVGVETVEAYTLPSALALVGVGLWRLRRLPESSTMVALAPGLTLALVPSLLWVLIDPVTWRSVVLGTGCLGLLLTGIRLRWSAPIVFATVVGSLLVLRHATPMAEAVPRWVLIGGAGMLLVALGITWERRLHEARAVLGYVRALR